MAPYLTKPVPRQVFDLNLVDIFTKEQHPYQHREFNYVFQFSVRDTETGEITMRDEYRTMATDIESDTTVLAEQLTSLIETEGT